MVYIGVDWIVLYLFDLRLVVIGLVWSGFEWFGLVLIFFMN